MNPASTYRLQFHAGFTFADATAIVPYLHQLGITHVYASPYLKARAGSTHGYDVIDHCSLNPELGTEADFGAFCDALAKHGMSHILDIVPNHVGVATNDNTWWNEVLANGPDSTYGKFFDIAWDGSPRPELQGKVLLPLLGGLYSDVLEKGEVKLTHDEVGFWVNYYDRRFPVNRKTLPLMDGDDAQPTLDRLNGTPGDARSFDALHELLEKQFYRLACWKSASDEINYRRFFDVNDLAALAMERQDVFQATHALIFKLIEQGKVTGLRLDHPDGLYDPARYFERLQQKYRETVRTGGGADEKPLYVLAEKILAPDEPLPTEWLIHGTSGYDFLNVVNGLFVDGRNERAFTETYDAFVGGAIPPYEDLVYEKKKLILTVALASELHMLAHRLDRLAQRYRGWRDFTFAALSDALRETIACFGVYRTYIDGPNLTPRDAAHVNAAIAAAKRRNPKAGEEIFDVIADVLLQIYPEGFTAEDKAAQLAFVGKFQQLTSPTTAKGIEDTTFYIYNRFVSLNEVGGEPSHFGVSPDRVHEYFTDRQTNWPSAMSTLSTHDTKRSEDVRARLNVLSELPDAWRLAVGRWRAINARHKAAVDGKPAPDANDEYLIYQTLVGAWPTEPWTNEEYASFGQRVGAYVLKAMREAKVHTAWTTPNKAYEEAATNFVSKLLDRTTGGEFLDGFAELRKRATAFGVVNSLSQTLLRLTAPGVPDTYQGTELWDLSLVDPDNRRPVDYGRRESALGELLLPSEAVALSLWHDRADGRAKLYVTATTLRARRRLPQLFSGGAYVPLRAVGERAEHVFAFARVDGNHAAIVVVPRMPVGLTGGDVHRFGDAGLWGDTRLRLPNDVATGTFRDAFTGRDIASPERSIAIADVLGTFPVAMLVSA